MSEMYRERRRGRYSIQGAKKILERSRSVGKQNPLVDFEDRHICALAFVPEAIESPPKAITHRYYRDSSSLSSNT